MQLDWFTFAAQIVNFLILIYLLKRFLYRPILKAMAGREARIAERLEAAERQSRAAAREAETYAAKTRGLEAMQAEILSDARTSADAERRAALETARQNIEETRRSWKHEVDREKAQFLLDLQAQLVHGVCDISRRVLADLADASLERQLVGIFLRRLHSLPDAEVRELRQSFTVQDVPVIVGCSFELGEDTRRMVQDGLAEMLGEQGQIRFEVHSDLGFGIALETPARRVEWSANSYLAELEEQLAGSLTAAAVTPAGNSVSPQPMRIT